MTSPQIYPHRPTVAVPCGAVLGEAPMWDPRTGTLFWVDIKSGLLFRWKPDGDAPPVTARFDDQLAFVKLTPDPDIVILGLKSGIARYDVRTGDRRHLLSPEAGRPGNRLNDAGTGPDGSLYFGSMDDAEKQPTGSFYHWSADGLVRFGDLAVVTNGPTVDSRRGLAYTADTTGNTISVHALGPDGRPGDSRLFVRIEEGVGHPDGLTLDSEGCLWVCHFGGARITRFSPDGNALLVVPMPTAKITKVAFGGADLATAYVTTASIGMDRQVDLQAGHLFTFEPGVMGLEPDYCRMAE